MYKGTVSGPSIIHRYHARVSANKEASCGKNYENWEMNIWYASLKLMPRFENLSVAGPEFRDKRKRGRPKRERGRSKRDRRRYVSGAAACFGNLCVYEPSALRKKPSDSSKTTFWFSDEAFQFSEEVFRFASESCRKRISERRSESRHQF